MAAGRLATSVGAAGCGCEAAAVRSSGPEDGAADGADGLAGGNGAEGPAGTDAVVSTAQVPYELSVPVFTSAIAFLTGIGMEELVDEIAAKLDENMSAT